MAFPHPGGNAILPIHFFKIILKTNLERLKIPTKFTSRYGGSMSNPVFFKPPDGTEWKVYWTKQNGDFWLEEGWKEFAEKYSLDDGHLMLFKYEGTCQFDVIIFDQSSTEIDYPSKNTSDEMRNLYQNSDDSVVILDETPPNHKARPKSPLFSPARRHKKVRNDSHGDTSGEKDNLVQSSGDSVIILDEIPLNHKAKPKSQLHQGTKFQKSIKKLKGVKGTQRTLSLNWPRATRAREEAEKFMSISKNPFFTVQIRPCHLAECKLVGLKTNTIYGETFMLSLLQRPVPNLLGDYIENKGPNVKLQLEKRSWPVKFICPPKHSSGSFSAGWSLFARESELQPGDVCIFELINRKDAVMKVHVSKSHYS